VVGLAAHSWLLASRSHVSSQRWRGVRGITRQNVSFCYSATDDYKASEAHSAHDESQQTMRNVLRDRPATSLTSEERVGAGRKDERSKATTHPTELFLLIAVFLLGTNPVAVKYAVSAFAPLPFVALRFTVAGLLLLGAVRLFLGSGGGVERKDLLAMMGVGALGVGATNMLFSSGVNLTNASDTALIYAVVPVWGMILGFVLGLERPTLRGILGVGIAFLGIIVVVYGGLGGSGSSLEGNLLVLGATVCWGSYTVLSLSLLEKYSPLVVAAYTMLFGGLAALPLALPGLQSVEWDAMSVGVWAAVAYSTVLVAAFGFFAWQKGASLLGANKVLVYQYLITLVGVISGIVFLGEELGVDKIIGGVIILSGVYLARRQ
jgi:drug/metabolite transporter (DMT)-like permease